ncbi:ABC transporter ATP-binding protein [Bacillus sp. WMMC1349]|uniref:ABC transporter ATP-binding protein n=1 Tax=Bacillus sp. WMMC1349 TaxID=2736254 RepID=UPI00155401E1|nr:ABC transporter ATP-binding protein [Bacillus sp. WMMC1349]NPC94546.1 ABC transporter ATP-binding protein [Bacillus sp. WMMC1349]
MLKINSFLKKLSQTSSFIFYGLKLFWRCDHIKSSILFFITLFSALLGPLLVWLGAKVIDEISHVPFKWSSWNSLFWMALIYIALTLIVDALQPIAEMQKRLLTAKLEAYVDVELMKKANSIPDIAAFEDASFHTNAQVIRYNEYFVMMWVTIVSQTFSGIVMIVAGSLLIGMFALWIPLLFLILALPKLYWEAKLNNATFEGRKEVQDLRRRAEYFAGVPLIPKTAGEMKMFNLVPFFKSSYRSTSMKLLQMISNDQRKLALFHLFWSVLQSLAVGGVLIYIVRQALQGTFSIGDLYLFIGAVVQFNDGINEWFAAVAIGARETRHLGNIYEFLNSKNAMETGETKLAAKKNQGYTFDHVKFSYDGSKTILDIEKLEIPLNKTTVIVGENGSGKSTLIKLLLRFFDPNQGTIFYNGLPLHVYQIEQFRSKATTVFQDFLRYEMTLKANIGLGDLASCENIAKIKKAALFGGVDLFLNKLESGYDTELGRLFGGRDLSGGQWQRIAIARSFMRDESADLFIFDEPSSALDVFIEKDIFAKLNQLKKGKTVIVVSHRLSTARFADHIIFLEKGKVAETGTHSELMKKQAHYASLYRLQAEKYL